MSLFVSFLGMWFLSTALGGDGGGAIATWLRCLGLKLTTSVSNHEFFGGHQPWCGADPAYNSKHSDIDKYFLYFFVYEYY